MRVAVLLPTMDEAESVGDVIRGVRNAGKDFSVFVVDSGSTDGTREIARRSGAKVISVEGRGKARAIGRAFAMVDADRVVLLDSDSSYCPEEIPLLLSALDESDVALGSRFRGRIEPGSMSAMNAFGNRALSFLASAIYGRGVSDVCSGFWAFRKNAYKAMEIQEGHFELEANFFAECAKRGLSLREVPITYRARRGKSKLSPLHGIGIGLFLLRRRFV